MFRKVKVRWLALVVVPAAIAVAAVGSRMAAGSRDHAFANAADKIAAGEQARESQGTENGGRGGESYEELIGAQQFADARTAPTGIVDPGAYAKAVGQLRGLGSVGQRWYDITAVKYDADDPDYRDYYSNSSGGSGNVTGRITGVAADDSGHVYVGGADGGVWRSSQGGGNWASITGDLPSLSTGDLQLYKGALWYATGEANTGGTSYVGSGVYRLASPVSGQFSELTDRVGGDELESTTINSLRFTANRVWASTLRGVWYMNLTTAGAPASAHWTLAFAPNPGYLPASLAQYSTTQTGFGTISTSSTTNAPYKNIVNDIAIDPRDSNHVLAAIGWRSGDSYNGLYETTDNGVSWTKINPQGGLDASDIGQVSFAYAADGSKLYAINQSPRKINSLGMVGSTVLDGIYVSNNGSLSGPWNRIASADKLGASSGGSALASVFGQGYSPGIQAWYNQFLVVDPANANHVYAGLEEVYETKDGGSSWTTVGPYWNFYFRCWAPDALYNSDTGAGNRCPLTTHSDQHSIAIGSVGGTKYVYVGNDGGIYRRPLNGSVNANGNATDWRSLNDGTIDTLQYYAVDIGRVSREDANRPDISTGDPVLVSGGLQDNGGSLLRPGAPKMVSNFGGDGGDVLVDPNDGCNIVQEYVFLSMSVTQTCANPGPDHPNAFLDLSQSTTYKVGPPDINARFIAPFVGNSSNVNEWLAGGNSLWVQNQGFSIRSGSAWKKAYTLASSVQVYTALAMSGDKAVGAWCGGCNNSGFARGVTIGTRDASQPSGWSFSALPTTGLPLRYVGGVAIGPDGTIYAAMNGFNRRFTEGPGSEVGHVFKYNPATQSWDDLSGTAGSAGAFPDVPANSIQALPKAGGTALLVATDLGVLYKAPEDVWKRLGTGLPLTVAMDVEVGPDNKVYAATHGRGIWRVALP